MWSPSVVGCLAVDVDVENASLHSWYQASDRPDLEFEDEEEGEEDQEVETVSLGLQVARAFRVVGHPTRLGLA